MEFKEIVYLYNKFVQEIFACLILRYLQVNNFYSGSTQIVYTTFHEYISVIRLDFMLDKNCLHFPETVFICIQKAFTNCLIKLGE